MNFHEYANIFPLMQGDEFQRLLEDIKKNGLQEPQITIFEGKIADGRNRWRACQQIGIETYVLKEWKGTKEELLTLIISKNLHRRHLTESQRAMVAARIKPMFEALAKERQGTRTDFLANLPKSEPIHSRDEAAKVMNVSSRTVHSAEKVITQGTDDLIKAVESGKISVSTGAIIADELKEEQQRIITQTPTEIIQEVKEIKEKKKVHVSQNSGNNEWFTPEEYIFSAKKVMGRIDLDPASCEEANQIVQAASYYDIETDGLKQEWQGRVWLNPPYSTDSINAFCEKLVESLESDVSQAIVLVNNATDTNWFYNLITNASAFVFRKGRIKFISTDGVKKSPLQGQVFIYFGERASEFLNEFEQYGWGGLLEV